MGYPNPHNRGPRRVIDPRRHPYFSPWGEVVGGRIRRLRDAQGVSLRELTERVRKPEGGQHSHSYLSRLERGVASAPFLTYVLVVEALDADPGRIFGPDPGAPGPDDAERMLLHCLRGLGIKPEEAMLRLLGRPLHADQQLEPFDGNGISGGAVVRD